MSNLKNKVAIITGAASGIGQATAVHFASLGCSLSLVDKDQARLQLTVSQCLEEGLAADQVLTYAGDLTHADVQEGLVSKTLSHFGQLHVLVNCAGVGAVNQTLATTTERDMDHIINVNLKTMVRLIQLSAPHLKLTKGSVVNVSSRLAIIPELFSLPYCLSKAGVDQLTRFAAKELAPDGVRVNSVNPDVVQTNIARNMPGMTDEMVKRLEEGPAKYGPIGRIAQPIEIAKPIAFLASDDASYITGVNLLIDGGRAIQ